MHLNMKKIYLLTLLSFLSNLGWCPHVLAQCTPTSARMCVASDDWSQVWVNGTSLGTFGYVNWDSSSSPPCVTVPLNALTANGSNICLGIYTQNTAVDNTYSSWVLDVTCNGGNHSVITSESGGLSENYVASGSPCAQAANDSSGNPWYATNYTGGGFSGSGAQVTATTWGKSIYNPITGQIVPFRGNDASGSYGDASGCIMWRQCTTLPNPQPTIGPPNVTITKTLAGSGFPSSQNLAVTFNVVVNNTGGPCTTSPLNVTDSFTTNTTAGGANTFQFQCWVWNSACWYGGGAGSSGPTSVNGTVASWGTFPATTSRTLQVSAISYYWPTGSCAALVNNVQIQVAKAARIGPICFPFVRRLRLLREHPREPPRPLLRFLHTLLLPRRLPPVPQPPHPHEHLLLRPLIRFLHTLLRLHRHPHLRRHEPLRPHRPEHRLRHPLPRPVTPTPTPTPYAYAHSYPNANSHTDTHTHPDTDPYTDSYPWS